MELGKDTKATICHCNHWVLIVDSWQSMTGHFGHDDVKIMVSNQGFQHTPPSTFVSMCHLFCGSENRSGSAFNQHSSVYAGGPLRSNPAVWSPVVFRPRKVYQCSHGLFTCIYLSHTYTSIIYIYISVTHTHIYIIYIYLSLHITLPHRMQKPKDPLSVTRWSPNFQRQDPSGFGITASSEAFHTPIFLDVFLMNVSDVFSTCDFSIVSFHVLEDQQIVLRSPAPAPPGFSSRVWGMLPTMAVEILNLRSDIWEIHRHTHNYIYVYTYMQYIYIYIL